MLQFSGTGVGAPLQHLASGGLRSSQLILLQLFCSLRFYRFVGCSTVSFPRDWWDYISRLCWSVPDWLGALLWWWCFDLFTHHSSQAMWYYMYFNSRLSPIIAHQCWQVHCWEDCDRGFRYCSVRGFHMTFLCWKCQWNHQRVWVMRISQLCWDTHPYQVSCTRDPTAEKRKIAR